MLEEQELKAAMEALLFISGSPVSLDRLAGIFEEAPPEQLEAQLALLRQECETRGSGLMLVEVAGGYQLTTRPEHAGRIRKIKSTKGTTKHYPAALPTLKEFQELEESEEMTREAADRAVENIGFVLPPDRRELSPVSLPEVTEV